MPRRYPAKAGTCMICSTRDNGYAFLHLPEDIHLTYDFILCHYFHKPTQRRYEILLNILDFTRNIYILLAEGQFLNKRTLPLLTFRPPELSKTVSEPPAQRSLFSLYHLKFYREDIRVTRNTTPSKTNPTPINFDLLVLLEQTPYLDTLEGEKSSHISPPQSSSER